MQIPLWMYGHDGEVGRTLVEIYCEEIILGNSFALDKPWNVRRSALMKYDRY
jgi:hypothetical protein